MNWCPENVEMAVPPGNAGDWIRAYFDSTSQGELVLSLPKEGPRTPGRTVISTVEAGNS